VNLSVRQFDDPQFFQALGNILGAEWLAPRQLRLEINEAQIAPNLAAVEALLARCKALGVKLIIDHFGTGQSALTYLHRLPVDGIKFDEGLIHDMATHDVSLRVAQAVNDLAASLDIDTGAAGVETAEQVVATRAAGFGLAQGFHYAPPLNFDDCASFLKARAASAKKAGLSR
jgi:EAL domain-containing protein (putative c-di-GMP-specific phosphodiesterase class I)